MKLLVAVEELFCAEMKLFSYFYVYFFDTDLHNNKTIIIKKKNAKFFLYLNIIFALLASFSQRGAYKRKYLGLSVWHHIRSRDQICKLQY